MKITKRKLINKLMKIRGATPVQFTSNTDARLNKRGNPYFGTRKVSEVNAIVGFYYDKAVLKRLEKEGKEPDAWKRGDSWHELLLIDNKITPFRVDKKTGKKLYLNVLVNTAESKYYFKGRQIDKKLIEKYMRDKNNYANQGLDNPVAICTYAIDNIRRITFGGHLYNVV